MTIERAAGLGLVSSLAGIAASIIRSKTSAVFLGPVGVGMAAEIQQVAALGLVPLAAFSGPALVQALARNRQGGARETAAALSWALLSGVTLSILVTAFSPWLLPTGWAGEQRSLVALACCAILLASLTGVANQTLVFEGRLATATKLSLATTVAGALLVATLTALFHLDGQLIALAATPALLLPVVLRKVGSSSLWPTPRQLPNFDLPFFRSSLTIGAASLIAGLALQAALYAIRWRLELSGGTELNGQFQASWAIGSVYLGMLLSGIGTFAFPRYAAAPDSVALQAEVDSAARFVRRLAPPAVLIALAFSGPAVFALYSHRFDAAVEILRWQLAGDVAKCFAWVYAGPLLFRGQVRAYLMTEFTAAGLLAGLTWLLVPRLGVNGVGIAYLGTYLCYLPIAALVAKRSIGVQARPVDMLSAIVISAILILMACTSHPVASASGTLLAVVWSWRTGLLSDLRSGLLARLRAHHR